VRGFGTGVDPSHRLLSFALTASLLLHAALLMLHFRPPEFNLGKQKESQLEVVLVNSKSARRPVEAQAKAQANLDGGGNTDENRLAKTPLPVADQIEEGDNIIEQRQRQREAQASSQRVMTSKKSETSIASENHRVEQPEPATQASGTDLAQTALAMARMEAAIDKNLEEYNKRPRRKVITARTQEVSYAMYFAQWRDKVERVGNLNYPEEAKGKLYGSVTLVVSILADGTLDTVEIRRRSSYPVLDDAALRILRMASPYGPFPAEMRRQYDVFDLVATVNFTKGEQVQSSLSSGQ
jgi:protein TonB